MKLQGVFSLKPIRREYCDIRRSFDYPVSIFSTYVIANSSHSERDLWMDKVNEAINGGAEGQTPSPSSSGKANPKLKMVTRQSTLKLLDT